MKTLRDCTVLVVDDTEANLDLLMEALGEAYRVSVALDGERDEEMLYAPAVEANPGPEGALMAAEESRAVARALLALSPECRQVLHLRYYRQLAYKEICAALSLPLGTVCSRLKRCLLHLRGQLESGSVAGGQRT